MNVATDEEIEMRRRSELLLFGGKLAEPEIDELIKLEFKAGPKSAKDQERYVELKTKAGDQGL
jgi:hypothetical protein